MLALAPSTGAELPAGWANPLGSKVTFQFRSAACNPPATPVLLIAIGEGEACKLALSAKHTTRNVTSSISLERMFWFPTKLRLEVIHSSVNA